MVIQSKEHFSITREPHPSVVEFGQYVYRTRMAQSHRFKEQYHPNINLVGRILKSSKGIFTHLAHEANRKTALFIDDRVLFRFITLSTTEMLTAMGYTDEYLAEIEANGAKLALFVTHTSHLTERGIIPELANWYNVHKTLCRMDPDDELLRTRWTNSHEKPPDEYRQLLEKRREFNINFRGDGIAGNILGQPIYEYVVPNLRLNSIPHILIPLAF